MKYQYARGYSTSSAGSTVVRTFCGGYYSSTLLQGLAEHHWSCPRNFKRKTNGSHPVLITFSNEEGSLRDCLQNKNIAASSR